MEYFLKFAKLWVTCSNNGLVNADRLRWFFLFFFMPLFGWTYASFTAPLLGKSLAHFLTFKMRQNRAASCVSVELRRKEQLGRRSWVISVVGHVYMKSFSSLQHCCIIRAQMNLVSPIMTEILFLPYSSVKLPGSTAWVLYRILLSFIKLILLSCFYQS